MTAKLLYRVECKSTHPFYEVIAAFNCAAAARFYAADCEAANPGFAYRVTRANKPLFEGRPEFKMVNGDVLECNPAITLE